MSTAMLALLVGLAAPAAATASISPATATLVIAAGGSGTEAKTVDVPAVPPKADIEIAIDTTASMTDAIAQAQLDALAIVNGVQSSVADAQFAVVQFRDSGDTPEYTVEQSMTGNATLISNAINGLVAGGGGDNPEAYNLVFHNSYTPALGGDIGWRSGSRKIVIVIGDAEPHGAGTDGFAGCTDVSADPHGFSTATELAGMATNERTLIMVRGVSAGTTTTLACYDSLAAAAFTGGDAVDAGTSLAADIVNLINAAFANVNDVHLEVVSAAPAPASATWVTFNPTAVGPVPAPSTQNFTVTVAVPVSTPPGTYNFDIRAVADGVDIGHQALTVTVFGFLAGGGAFVIGNNNSAIGTNVTFWGAQWWKLNSLTGGSAPASFKGFALNTSTPPTCNTTWTTDPGNSAPPPAGPLPSLMGVIVSSSITKSGSTISGDIAHIVVVQTNPGYQPNPGHAGTGKVVAVVC